MSKKTEEGATPVKATTIRELMGKDGPSDSSRLLIPNAFPEGRFDAEKSELDSRLQEAVEEAVPVCTQCGEKGKIHIKKKTRTHYSGKRGVYGPASHGNVSTSVVVEFLYCDCGQTYYNSDSIVGKIRLILQRLADISDEQINSRPKHC